MGQGITFEAARLFFAISALILVGMLTTPTGVSQPKTPVTAQRTIAANSNAKIQKSKVKKSRTQKAMKVSDRKAKKITLKKG